MDTTETRNHLQRMVCTILAFEHENCGIGAVVNMDGTSDRKVVDSALRIVETLEHRAGKDAEGKTGDGVGILLQISHTYFFKR